MTSYVIQGIPTAYKTMSFGNRKAYDTQYKLKQALRFIIKKQHNKLAYFDGPLHLDITFYFKPPQSWSKKKQLAVIGKPHIVKPDTSNLVKMYEDIGKGILYKDDCTIASISAKKLYDYTARTEFTITVVGEYQS